MNSKKLTSAMSIALTALFVAFGPVLYYAYISVMTLLSGGGIPTDTMVLIFNLICPLLMSLAMIVLFVLCFIGAGKAKHDEHAKGLFITIAFFEIIFAAAALALSGYYIYTVFQGLTISGIMDIIELLILEIAIVCLPLLFAGIAVLISAIKVFVGNKGDRPAKQAAPAMENVQPVEQQPAQSNQTPPPFPPRPPEFGN